MYGSRYRLEEYGREQGERRVVHEEDEGEGSRWLKEEREVAKEVVSRTFRLEVERELGESPTAP